MFLAALGLLAAVRIGRLGRAKMELEQSLLDRTAALAQVSRRLEEAERIARLGHWERNLVTGEGFWSDQNFVIYGLEREESAPELSRFLACIHPEDRRLVLRARASVLAGNDRYHVRYRLLRPDGSVRHLLAQAEVIRDSAGRALRLVGTTLDDTVQQTTHQALEENHAALTSVINATEQDIIALIRPDGTVEIANHKAAEIYGQTAAKIIGQRLDQFMSMEDAIAFQKRVNLVLTFGSPIQLQQTLRDQVFETHMAPARRPNGEVTGVAVFCRNITALKQIEQNLRQLARIVEQAPLSVIITDLEGAITYVNPHFTTMTGYQAEEVLGASPRVLKSGYTAAADYAALWRTIAAGEVWHGEFHNRTKDGRLFWERSTIAPVRNDQGWVSNYVAVKEDITELKRAEQELLAAKERAEAANVARSRFLASVSHELRTPLNAIIGFSECMRDTAFGPIGDPRYQRFAGSIHEAGTNLLTLINDILDQANAEAGTLELNETMVDPHQELLSAVADVREPAEAKGVTLVTHFPDSLPLLYADIRALRKIAGALLSNAVKFTPTGGNITVQAGCESSGLFAFTVADTGIGIPAEQLDLVMTPFGMVDGDMAREHGGVGIGLTLSRSIAELHGGHLEIESTPGHGTTVTTRFPANRVIRADQEHSTAR